MLSNPVIQGLGALPAGVHAPNTLITEHAVDTLGLSFSISTYAWFVQSAAPLTAAEIHNAQAVAAPASLSVETKNEEPTSSAIINSATVFGIVLALCILAMSIGLIRSETSGDLRTLAATGASSYTRRAITAVTAGALGLLGANLLTITLGLPLVAAAVGWLLAGRQPAAMSRQPIE